MSVILASFSGSNTAYSLDRHPSNFMLDRYTGKLIHIDLGDCFEVAMQRDKFPENFHLDLQECCLKQWRFLELKVISVLPVM